MEGSEFYRHQDLFNACLKCKSCIDRQYLSTPFEDRRLPVPWQGTAGSGVKVLFLFAKPSFTRQSPRLLDFPSSSAMRDMLEQEYENHAIAFKQRRSVPGSFRSGATKIAALLLDRKEEEVRDFDDYLFTSLIRCESGDVQDMKLLELLTIECLTLHGAPLFRRLPNLQWIVPVGVAAQRLLALPAVWMAFCKALSIRDGATWMPGVVDGVSETMPLTDRIRLIAVPHFGRGRLRGEHYSRITSSRGVLYAPRPGAVQLNVPTLTAIATGRAMGA